MDQLVSVVIPTYNRPAQLKRALDAVFDQTHRAVEAIVVNDGGCSIEHVTTSHPAAGRIHCLVQPGNKGPNAARNVGLRAARGTYVAYLDDDDRWRPDHLATVLGAMARQDKAVGYADALEVRVRYEEGRRIEVARSRPFSCDFDADRLALWPHIPTLCIVHRRSCLEQGGYFDESLQRCEDWEMWLRLSRVFPFAHVARTTCEFDTVLNGASLRALGVGPHIEATLAIRSKHDGWMRRTRYAALFYPLFLRQLRSLWSSQPGQVIGLLERVAEITDYRADALSDLGFLHAKCGQHEAARDALGRAIALSPHHPAALVTLARLEDEAGAQGRAQELLQAALNADPYNEDARREHERLAAGLSAGAGSFPLPQVRISVDTTPNDAFVWDAVDIAQPEPWRGIVVDPSVERELTDSTGPRTVATVYLLWLAGRRRADEAATAAAEQRLVDCLDAEPWHPEVLSTLDVLVGFASGLEERGKLGLANRVFGRLASLLKGQEGMHEVEAMVDYRLGKLALEDGNLAAATKAFEDCLSLQPNHGQAAAALHEATRQRVLRRLSPAASPASAEGRSQVTDGPRLFVIDQNLRGAGGHFLAYDSSVARAAAAVGIAPMLVANRQVRVSPAGLPVRAVLPYTSWEELSSTPAHAYDHFAERATSTAWRLADFFAEHDITEHDVVFAPNATIVTAQAFARLALLSGRAFPRTALLYRMELAEQVQFTGLGPRVGTAILRQALADISAAIPASSVRLYTDSDELTEDTRAPPGGGSRRPRSPWRPSSASPGRCLKGRPPCCTWGMRAPKRDTCTSRRWPQPFTTNCGPSGSSSSCRAISMSREGNQGSRRPSSAFPACPG